MYPNLFNGNHCYCPICEQYFCESSFLKSVFTDEKVRWLANQITHYRHGHISSWNKCWGYNGHHYRSGWFGDYEEEKHKVNERAKRQIIRKAGSYLLFHGINRSHFEQLKNTEDKTLSLAQKKLDEAA